MTSNTAHTTATSATLTTFDEYQAAEVLGFSVKTLQKRRWAGQEPKFLKVGRKVRYRLSDLQDYLDRCTVEPRTVG